MKDISSLNENQIKDLIYNLWVIKEPKGLRNRQDKIDSIDYLKKKKLSNITFDELIIRFGQEFVVNIIKNINEIRINFLTQLILANKLNEEKATCHLCGKNKTDKTFDFMMGQLVHSERNWTQFFVVNGLSTIALLAGAKGKFILRPQGHKQYKTIRLQLCLCSDCLEQRKNFFGQLRLRESDYEKHPSLEIAQQIGYNVLIPNKDIHKYG